MNYLSIIIPKEVFEHLSKESKRELLSLNGQIFTGPLDTAQLDVELVSRENYTDLANAKHVYDTFKELTKLRKENMELKQLKSSLATIKKHIGEL